MECGHAGGDSARYSLRTCVDARSGQMAEAYIVEAVRTPAGRKGGGLAAVHPADLAGHVLTEVLRRSGADPAAVDDVILGCVDQVGAQTFNIARTAWVGAELPDMVPLAAGARAGAAAGYGSPFGGKGWLERYGDQEITQFRGAELMAERWDISREAMERVAFASQISDGAGALLLASEGAVRRFGLRPRARVHAMALAGSDPVMMLTAPIPATQRVLKSASLTMDDIDLFEINEAFAPVVLAWQRETGADLERTNVNGGAIALGHPLGASGAKLATTLLHELERSGGRYGLQTMCEGGGMANATIIERLG